MVKEKCWVIELRLTYVENLCQISIAVVSLFSVERADLHIRLLHDELLLSEALVPHQVLVAGQLGLELSCTRRREQAQQGEHFLVSLCELLDSRQVHKLCKVDDIDGLDGEDDAAAGVVLRTCQALLRIVES